MPLPRGFVREAGYYLESALTALLNPLNDHLLYKRIRYYSAGAYSSGRGVKLTVTLAVLRPASCPSAVGGSGTLLLSDPKPFN